MKLDRNPMMYIHFLLFGWIAFIFSIILISTIIEYNDQKSMDEFHANLKGDDSLFFYEAGKVVGKAQAQQTINNCNDFDELKVKSDMEGDE